MNRIVAAILAAPGYVALVLVFAFLRSMKFVVDAGSRVRTGARAVGGETA